MPRLASVLTTEHQVKEYLATYGAVPGYKRTAVIKIGGEVISNELDVLVDSLVFLRDAGLHPVVIHGAGPQMNAQLAEAGIEPQYVQGNRVTDKATLAIARRVFLKANNTLVNGLAKAGAPARPITSGVFEAEFKDEQVYGYVGEVVKIWDEAIQSAIDLGEIPVLSCLGETVEGQTLNINADVAARELSLRLQPHKTVFINAKGGWIEDDGTKLKRIDMAQDYEAMASRDYTGRQGTLLKLNEINALLQGLPSSASVSLTSASELCREILDSASSGTICVKGEHSQAIRKVKPVRVGLLGARGFVGRELIRLIGQHPHLELVCSSSRALVGQKVKIVANAPPMNPHTHRPVGSSERVPLDISEELEFCDMGLKHLQESELCGTVDVWILALPNGHCEKYASALDQVKKKGAVIIDLSADQRFNSQWTYGLPEAPTARTVIRNAHHISNPGCYATGAQLALLPILGGKPNVCERLLDESVPPHVFGVSGYSGAGTSVVDANNPRILKDNIMAYKSVKHIHEVEISHQLGTPVRFMPHVAPFFQGIHLTVSAQLNDHSLSVERLRELYEAYYSDERLIQVQQSVPMVKENAHRHDVTLGGIQIDPESGRVVIVSTIDNLLKGAATQAIQNINIALGIDEYVGIIP